MRRLHESLIKDELRKGHNHNVPEAVIYKHHMEKFCSWFRGHVMSLTTADREKEGVSDTLVALSKGPYIYVKRLKYYVINGLKFRSVNNESNKKMQNIGVSVVTEGARDVFDAGIGPQRDEDDTYSFSENVPYNISNNEVVSQNLSWARDDIDGMTIDASIIAERDHHEVNNLDECEFIDDESDNEDDNEDEYTDDE
nr:hypothetical protein CFP56_66452 [Quercus suber]